MTVALTHCGSRLLSVRSSGVVCLLNARSLGVVSTVCDQQLSRLHCFDEAYVCVCFWCSHVTVCE